ncbi:efflux transporter outer membrane subunit [Rhizobium sp. VS19-DR104.2]|uniref:efflux transporter outer membrane subunit n=1 Tax=unclassified Rhizobium TaxID=2613769 RepID=UPI001CC82C64|nr:MULTISPECIES: efflux transporter outer membrane subunit [unclassified Rhizobium]MBZ5762617.1 efflux transporter outer membrane subunit [Rhizobium sp. VS19-DR96]MBZ5768095.1 efflux transporter outer membrane subunit [Rhizobium sp. VS19-DR129.2]MBZ5775535.1 efflux transporter outer membrane subunit [Rhizobium sp. VS19-DRK62.2]MBZ5787347.1 efflux transporter outer membrane subunit [Rhizobium sp. VS19-DR121]MBZ5804021.1 efflux transporter outer membrane subunit [Rhizobium sp. VS19-DR181]
MIFPRAASPAILLLLAGCVSGPDHKPPVMPLPPTFSEGTTKANEDIAGRQWWTAYHDKKLESLVATGLAQNVSILSSIEATVAAQGDVTVAGAGALPSLSADGSNTTSGEKGKLRTQLATTNSTAGDLTASWLLDLFGQYRRAREGALDSLDAAYATVDVTRLTYLQDLVTSYINARYYQARISIAADSLASRRKTLELTKFQMVAGAASRLDVVQAEGLVNSTLSEAPGLEISYRQQVHHIATLLNMPPTTVIADMRSGGRQPVFRGNVATGVPADLIRNRPDIRKAERDLAAATAQIGVAEAKLYPSISLSGSISPSYVTSSGSHGSLTSWSFGPTLNLPILDGGSLRANVKIAESNARADYLTWKSTVLTAVEDVENALSAVRRDAQTISALRAQVNSYQEALQLSTDSYKDGASSLLNVIDAQLSLATAKESLAAAIQQSATDYVSLNVAIGAGYAGTDKGPRI